MKALIKKILLFLAFVLHRNKKSKVIYYHDIGNDYTPMGTKSDLMRRHFEIVMLQGYSFVEDITKRERQVKVCFDDGWAGIYENRKVLVDYGVKPTIFLAVSLIGNAGYLSIEQINELMSLGFHFQSHTWSHEDLTLFTEEELKHELKDSKDWLEKTFNVPFDDICYPMGRFSNLVIEKCREFGYKNQYTSLPGGVNDLEDENLLCRNCIQDSSPLEFKWMLNSTSILYTRKLKKLHFQD